MAAENRARRAENAHAAVLSASRIGLVFRVGGVSHFFHFKISKREAKKL